MDKILDGLSHLAALINSPSHENNPQAAAEAIMTTDTRPKMAGKVLPEGTLWGCAKGAGMIHPAMTPTGKPPSTRPAGGHATMLSYLLTDFKVPPALLQKLLNQAVEKSFNRVSVEGDTSTNDTVLFLANGATGTPLPEKGPVYDRFVTALEEICVTLAKAIAGDGEGATKLISIQVKNAPTPKAAKRLAEVIATSVLLKTALYGGDPNWGRLLGAMGRSGVSFKPEKVDVYYGRTCVCRDGASTGSARTAQAELKGREIQIIVDLKQGKAQDHYWTCDLSPEFVKINADYN